jgi:hypothetical protein
LSRLVGGAAKKPPLQPEKLIQTVSKGNPSLQGVAGKPGQAFVPRNDGLIEIQKRFGQKSPKTLF